METVPCFAAALLFLLSTAASLNIDTSDGGYREVWVSISESVPPNQSIIDNIKALFRSSSEFLHKATNGRVYFKQVTIEVPKTWPKRSSARALSSNAFDKSDVRIDMPTKQYGDKPFTHQVKPCGQPGDFIQLTPGFLATLTNSTAKRSINPAYVFVHEWAHFRYGVFDEYGSLNDSRYPLTYCHREKVRLNACSSKIAFVARTADGGTCSMDTECRFLDDCVVTFYQPPKDDPVESSIMFMPYIANDYNRIGFLQEAAKRYLGDIEDGSRRLAIVAFSSHAQVVHTLMPVNVNTRHRFLDAIEKLSAYGGTCIGCGLDTALKADTVEVSVRVKSEPRTKDDEPIRVSCEMSNMLVDKFDKAIVYAKVTKGKKVVLDAVVFATVYRPKMQDAPQAITIPLHDDGKDPDVHPDDGTYSGYFTQFTGKGRYAVAAHVSNQKTTRLAEPLSGSGSFFTTALLSATTEVPTGTSFEPASEYPIHDFVVVNTTTETRNTTGAPVQTVDPFERVASGGSFQVTVEILEKQVPPGDIRDLAVTDVLPGDNDTLMVKLTWTWPGAHLTSGNGPDVNSNDGVYSGYFTQFNGMGRYTVMAVVSTQKTTRLAKSLGGSGTFLTTSFLHGMSEAATGTSFESASEFQVSMFEIIDGTTEDTTADRVDDFQRVASGGCFQVTEDIVEEDVPPGKIWDLAVEDVRPGEYLTLLVELTWTWPGAHLTSGMEAATGTSFESASEFQVSMFEIIDGTTEDTTADTVDDFQRVASGGSFQVTEDIVEEDVPPGKIWDLAVEDVRPGEYLTLLVELTWTWPGAHLTSGMVPTDKMGTVTGFAPTLLLLLSTASSVDIDTSDRSNKELGVSIGDNVPPDESIIDNVKVGMWTLHVTSSTSAPEEVSVRVKSEPRGKDDEPIRVSCEMGIMLVDRSDGAVVYAKVTKDKKVILDAVVFATVHRPKMQDASHAITISLHDDGRGPDVHSNDGVYSGYFTQFTGMGRYTVMAVVSTQKTTRLAKPLSGSGTFFTTSFLHGMSEAATGTSFESASEFQVSMFEIIDGTTEDTTADRVDDFQRVASAGSFQVTEDIVEEDVPPEKIWDLAVEDVRPGEYLTLLVELTWTWPGAHLTSGMGPDVHSNDGVYSGYFTQFTGMGRYTVMAVVSTQKTTRLAKPLSGSGSFLTTSFLHGMSEAATGTSFESASEFQVSMFEIIDGTTEDTTADRVDDFQRVASGGSFLVTEDIVEEDVPPRKIWDLAVEDVRPGEYLTLLLELTWTWPGAHLTSGM
ncbi:hypothetical protein V5799_033695, partial [Amblyomma americanum]